MAIPPKIEIDNNEYKMCIKINKIIDYLYKTSNYINMNIITLLNYLLDIIEKLDPKYFNILKKKYKIIDNNKIDVFGKKNYNELIKLKKEQ